MKESQAKPFYIVAFILGACAGIVGIALMFDAIKPEGVRRSSSPSEVQSETAVSSTQGGEEPIAEEDEASNVSLNVTWKGIAEEIPLDQALEIFSSFVSDPEYFTGKGVSDGEDVMEKVYSVWNSGAVKGGDLDGGEVYLVRTFQDVMGGESGYAYLVLSKDGKRLVSLKRYGAELQAMRLEKSNAFVPSLETKASYVLKTGKKIFLKPRVRSFEWQQFRSELVKDSDMDLKRVGETQEGFEVFSGSEGCFVVFRADGAAIKYEAPFPGKRDESGFLLPDVKWNASYANTNLFLDKNVSGCGSYGCAYVATAAEVGPQSSLVLAGKGPNGELVYVPKDPAKHPLIQEIYDSWYIPDGKSKPPIEDFIAKYPVPMFFWRDAAWRWNKVTVSDLIPPAECGKPVIYLYPEKTAEVSVKLPSFVNVTVSEPTYPSRGWKTTANPDGSLRMADGSTYGSLFWEGTGVGFEKPRDGFVVKDGDVEAFLRETLARYGLNEKESAEFREFWVPLMKGSPYYRVSFLTDAWSKAAPLNVSPAPHTSIRLFMDWQKLSAPISLPEPKIVTPKREGFTLVEWGGMLWK